MRLIHQGAIFTEKWKRENARLAFEWDVENFENNEPDLPAYSRKQKLRASSQNAMQTFIWSHEKFLKYAISFIILIFMVFLF